MIKQLLIAASIATLASCQTASPDVVERDSAQRLSTVDDATVLSARPVKIDGSQSGLGAVGGAVAGGIAGSNVGGPRGSGIVGIAGAIAGGVVGNAIEREATKQDGVEILLQMKNGERRSVIQADGGEMFSSGDAVIVVTTGNRVRVLRSPVVPRSYPPSAAQASSGASPT
jgi:outer membrane lipoprotein SlyB